MSIMNLSIVTTGLLIFFCSDLDVSWFQFSRKNFLYPDEQHSPVRCVVLVFVSHSCVDTFFGSTNRSMRKLSIVEKFSPMASRTFWDH